MNRIARSVAARPGMSWLILFFAAVFLGWLAGGIIIGSRIDERRSLLETEAQRRSLEVMSQTLNGNLMGSMAVLGLINQEIKNEALGTSSASPAALLSSFESIARSYNAQGIFIVREDGIIGPSWDSAGKPSTGLNVKFRPYYQMAMQGKNNVYAAVSLARGDRALYFSAPVFRESSADSKPVGAIVARTDLTVVDALLRKTANNTLLLSPQGVVFASSRTEWIGHLSGRPTQERLQAIRELKQFGNLFDKKVPPVLPMATEPGIREADGKRQAIADAKVQWNDPMGDWTLVLMEDLSRTVPLSEYVGYRLGACLLVLFLGWGLIHLLQSQYAKQLAGEQLAAVSARQQAAAEANARLSEAGIQMQQSRQIDELLRCYFSTTHRMFGSLQGVFYRVDRSAPDRLVLAGSYACAEEPPAQIMAGEGLLGQCAVEKRIRTIEAPPTGYTAIHSGLGETLPTALLLAPVMLHDTLLGVVELALLHIPDATKEEQFGELNDLLAMNLEIISRSTSTEEQLVFQQALLDTIPYPVFYKGADTRFLGLNSTYERTFGVLREALIGKRVTDLEYLPETERLACQLEDETVIADGATVKHDRAITFADGTIHDTIYSASGFRKPDGTPGGMVGTFIDISDLKQAQNELLRLSDAERFSRLAQGREMRILELKQEINALAMEAGKEPPYATTLVETVGDHEYNPHPDYRTDLTGDSSALQLADLVDIQELQTLFTAFCESVCIASAIIDLQGTVLVAARWQRACTDFHRGNAESCKLCIESDTELALKLQTGQDFTMYTCKNGLTDAASPIIVEGRHLANVFIGQFHLRQPDLDFFRRQAQRFGFPEDDYLQAISEAPVIDEARLPAILGFLSGFARMLSTMSLARHRADTAQMQLQQQAELLRRERLAAMSLAEDASAARRNKLQGGQP